MNVRLKRSLVFKRLLVILMTLVMLFTAACVKPTVPDGDNDDKDKDEVVMPTKISFDTSMGTEFGIGSHTIKAKIEPAEASQDFVVSLAQSYDGVSLNGKTVTITKDAVDVPSIQVTATAVADTSVKVSRWFGLSVPEYGISITNVTVEIDLDNGLTYQILHSSMPTDMAVKFSLLTPVDGVSINGSTGLVTISNTIDNRTKFRVLVESVDDPEINAQKEFTIINNLPRFINSKEDFLALWPDATTETQEDPQYLANLNNNYRLMTDLEFSSEEDGNWYYYMATGDYNGTVGFAGVFDGNGHTITFDDFYLGGFNFGFFGRIASSGVVKNLGFKGTARAAGPSGGIVTGYNHGTLENIIVDVDLTVTFTQSGANNWVGALYGASNNKSYTSKVINCISVGTISVINNGTSGKKTGLIGSSGDIKTNTFPEGTKSFALAGTVDELIALASGNALPVVWVAGRAEAKNEAALKTASTYSGWDTNVWFLANGIYPTLKYPGFDPEDIGYAELPEVEITVVTDTIALDYSVPGERTLQIVASASAADPSDEVLNYKLLEPVTGVSIDTESGLVTITEDVNNQAQFTVVIYALSNIYTEEYLTVTVTNDAVREITNLSELMALSGNGEILYNNYKLTDDIVLEQGWTPIGAGIASGYHGNFDGQGYEVSNFTITGKGANAGFFYSIASDGKVEKLSLKGGIGGVNSVSGGAFAGLLKGMIENCFADVDVTSTDTTEPGGGIAGIVSGSYAITNCLYVGNALSSATGANGAGFIASGSAAGITNSFALDAGAAHVIGAGKIDTPAGIILSDADLRTAATFSAWDGGDQDTNIWYVVDGSRPSLIYPGWTAPAGTVEITNTKTHFNYDNGETSFQVSVTSTNVTTVVYSLETAVTGIAIDSTGEVTFTSSLAGGTTYFTVVVESDDDASVTDSKIFSVEKTTEIRTSDELRAIGKTGNYILMNNITLSGNTSITFGEAYAANTANGFKGVLDGNGYTITLNISGSGSTSWNGGLFLVIGGGGVVKNLGIAGTIASNCGAAFAGCLYGTLENCFVTATIKLASNTNQFLGGLAGSIQTTAQINNCLFVGATDMTPYTSGTNTQGGFIGSGNGLTLLTQNKIVKSFALDTSVNRAVGTGVTSSGETDADYNTACLRTAAELKDAATFTGWPTTVWDLSDCDGSTGYPKLINGCTKASV